ncbi:MAG TPA: 2,3-bisphosphoglycerate-independent phosphoglycerate mutase, partial [Coxiellaceae bacterium]|nr:2,3-bisphosphoglycerate-independent phosphoglycerate mutase [Coxiellaceae bacterium]
PKSAEASLNKLDTLFRELNCGRIASIIGRYYAMDRDQRWDRVEKAYNLLIEAKADYAAPNAIQALKDAYERGESDEFVKPTVIGKAAPIQDGDIIIFMNFRADRARQISHALVDAHFNAFKRNKVVQLGAFLSLTEYDENLSAEVIFPPIDIHNTLGEYVASQGLKQLRIAETEKYAHVTYFFSGGAETPFDQEDRCLIPSPKVATYDLQPEMSAAELTDKLVEAILSRQYSTIICNYANFDMIGHTGDPAAALKTISTIDGCLSRVLAALAEANMDALITADHGNIECIFDETNGQAHTAHTTNLVPLVYVGKRPATFTDQEGSLKDVAPTLLYLMGLTQAFEMTGHNLITLKS